MKSPSCLQISSGAFQVVHLVWIFLLTTAGAIQSSVVINELGLDSSSNSGPFIELHNPGSDSFSVTNFSVVLFNATSAYAILQLSAVQLPAQGYYVISSGGLNPPADLEWMDDRTINSSVGAVAVYDGEVGRIGIGMEPTDRFLEDAIIFSRSPTADAAALTRELNIEIVVLQDQLYLPRSDFSISRCTRHGSIEYALTSRSPNRTNLCENVIIPSPIVINEVNALNPGEDTQEYIELYNKANISILLTDYFLVLYNGNTDRAYNVIPLNNATVNPEGYFLIGSPNVQPTPQKLLGGRLMVNILQNGIAAVALYKGNASSISEGSDVTNASLVDAVVYDKGGRQDQELVDALIPGQSTVHEESARIIGLDESISRCEGNDRFVASQFQVTNLTPGAENDCTTPNIFPTLPPHIVPNYPPINPEVLPSIVLSEVRVTGSQPFIELFDGGIGSVSLDSIVIVFYSGRSLSVYAEPITLNGFSTKQNGIFLIGSGDLVPRPDFVLQAEPLAAEGCNAVAIHLLEITTIQYGSPVMRDSLIDVVVYGEPTAPEDQDLIDTLAPGQTPQEISSDDDKSWSRCRGWERFMQDSFTLGSATPKAVNVCPIPPYVINEVNVAAGEGTNQFIELYDGGMGSQVLDGLVVVLYDGRDDRSYLALDLTGYATDEAGFLVLGPENGTNVDYYVGSNRMFLQGGPDAVALHVGAAKYFRGKRASEFNLVDAVVYGTDDAPDLNLLHLLLPNQHHLNEVPHQDQSEPSPDMSISRCHCCLQTNHSSFGLAPASPGTINIDCYRDNTTLMETVDLYHRRLRINEVKFDDGDAEMGGGFVEIFDGGLGGIDLSEIQIDILIMNANDESLFLRFNLDGNLTDQSGYFLIDSPSPTLAPIAVMNRTRTSRDESKFDSSMPFLKPSDAGYVQLISVALNLTIDTITFGIISTNDWMTMGSLDVDQPLIVINDTVTSGENSIQRCYSPKQKEQLAFAISTPTPRMGSSCPLPPIVINEINTDSAIIELGEYVELSSLGVPYFPINNVTLVSINGTTGAIHRSLTLNGYQTDARGLLLIGYRSLSVPRPDVPRFRRPTGWICDGPDAVAIFLGRRQTYAEGSTPSEEYLIDRVDYGHEEVAMSAEGDTSISRCSHANGTVSYEVTNVSPKEVNLCPVRGDVVLVINEVGMLADQQFIELWDLGNGFTLLDDFVIVLYGDDDLSYASYNLTGHTTNQAGYFVIGGRGNSPLPHKVVDNGFMRTNYGSVALYRKSWEMLFTAGQSPGTEGLLDAVVYSDWSNGSATGLSKSLLPQSLPIPSDLLQAPSSSLSRCFSIAPLRMSAFLVYPSSPNGLNRCPAFITDVVINEINVDLPGVDNLEFIELYDGGRGNASLDFTTLVLFNGRSDRSYLALGLDGYRTDTDGYFVIGSHLLGQSADLTVHKATRGFLQNGPDAIALYRAHVGAFPFGTEVTSAGLIDAVVYSTNNKRDRRMVNTLVPGYFTIKEERQHLEEDESLSRCHGTQRQDPTVYAMTVPTLGQANNCSAFTDFDSSVIINELNIVDDVSWFVEIYDHGAGHTLLNGFLLVFFDGDDDDKSYYTLDLSNRITSAEGYYVIGTSQSSPDLELPDDLLQEGSDAVVLYRADPSGFPPGSNLSLDDVQDAVVYGSSLATDQSLMTSLALGQMQVVEGRGASSASRCLSDRPVTMSAFVSANATPGIANSCQQPSIIINELNMENPDTGSKEFVELYDGGGQGSMALDSLILVLYSGVNGGRAFKTIPLHGHSTDENGFFLIGTSQDASAVDLEYSYLLRGASAVALYRGDHRDYQLGMPATTLGLVDALVFGDINQQSVALLAEFLPAGQDRVNGDARFSTGLLGLSRCDCCQPLRSEAFTLAPPSPRQPNLCVTHGATPPSTPPHSHIFINEINLYDAVKGGKEFIELKGPANSALDDYIIVVVGGDGNMVSHAIGLTGKRLDHKGFFLAGASSVTPTPSLILAAVVNGTLKTTGGAVAIFRGHTGAIDIESANYVNRIVDAIVFNSEGRSSHVLSVLTPTGDVFSDYSSSQATGDESISRCVCCPLRSNDAFMLSSPTPGTDNLCPAHKYSQRIALRVEGMDYALWGDSPVMLAALRDVVVKGVKDNCHCAFSDIYLKDEELSNGSVIYEASMLAVSADQATQLIYAYMEFVEKTKTIAVFGEEYVIDNTCIVDCKPRGKAGRRTTILQHPGPSVIVGVTVAVLVMVACAAATISYLKRKIATPFTIGSFKYYKEEIDLDGELRVTGSCKLEDLDILSRETNDNFVNPVYVSSSLEPPDPGMVYGGGGEGDLGSVELEVDTSISYA